MEIHKYYKDIENREKKVSINESKMNMMNMNGNMKNSQQQPYQTYPIESPGQSRYKNNQKTKVQSKTNLYQDGDIPLLNLQSQFNSSLNSNGYGNMMVVSKQSLQNLGNIPLLDLGEETLNPTAKNKIKKAKGTKR